MGSHQTTAKGVPIMTTDKVIAALGASKGPKRAKRTRGQMERRPELSVEHDDDLRSLIQRLMDDTLLIGGGHSNPKREESLRRIWME